jgi:hypothetical protein
MLETFSIAGDQRSLLLCAPPFQLTFAIDGLGRGSALFCVNKIDREPQGGVMRAKAQTVLVQPRRDIIAVTHVEGVIPATSDVHPRHL